MKLFRWKNTLELMGIVSTLASLIFMAVQLTKEENLLELKLQNYMIASSVAVTAVDPTRTVTSGWIEGMNAAIEV